MHLESCDILHSQLRPAANGSSFRVTYWLYIHAGWVWLCSVFWAHHLLSHSYCHPRPRQYQIGSSSVENYEQIKKDYSCEMNQASVLHLVSPDENTPAPFLRPVGRSQSHEYTGIIRDPLWPCFEVMYKVSPRAAVSTVLETMSHLGGYRVAHQDVTARKQGLTHGD